MEWVLLALTAGGAVTYTTRSLGTRRADHQAQVEILREMRRLADADAQRDYRTALDAYERGKWEAPRMKDPDQISRLVDTLATGRYTLACVYAHTDGRPPPPHRLPCFFNPQHGPSPAT